MNKRLPSISPDLSKAIFAQFPELKKVNEVDPHSMSRVAVSVFDHWLHDESEWHLFDCFSGPERKARDEKFLAHWSAIYDYTNVYTVRSRGRWSVKSKLVLKRFLDKPFYMQKSKILMHLSPNQFIVLPEFDCIYAASWDDTNVLFFNDRVKAEPILQLAKNVGLHILEFDD